MSINILWNDISIYYSKKAYPLINEIENLMRKLIMKFMFVNVGMDWFEEKVPFEVKEEINKKKGEKSKKLLQDALQEADFIHLSDLLFKKYRATSINKLDNLIEKSQKIEDLNFENLKNFFPQSNWDRYFSQSIEYKGEDLQSKWEDLYDLRNKVAHNKDVNKADFERIQSLIASIKDKISEAINKLKEINLDTQQQEEIIDSVGKIYEEEPTNYLPISEEELLRELEKSEIWAERKSAFVGLKYFVMNILGDKSYDYATSFDIINDLINKGIIQKYEVISPEGFPVAAIKLNKKTQNEIL